MKKVFFVMTAVCLMALMLLPEAAYCRRRGGNLYEMLSERTMVKTYVAPVTDSTGEGRADVRSLRETIESFMMARMTINFNIVQEASSSDIIIGCDVVEYFWTDKDPIDNITGTVAVAWDAINRQNYARMTAVFTVMDAKTKDILWKKKIKATITDEFMTPDESVKMVNERITKIFMRDAFSKRRPRKMGIM